MKYLLAVILDPINYLFRFILGLIWAFVLYQLIYLCIFLVNWRRAADEYKPMKEFLEILI